MIRRIAYILLAVLVSLIAAELALRLLGYGPRRLMAELPDRASQVSSRYTDSIGFDLKPGHYTPVMGGQELSVTNTSYASRAVFMAEQNPVQPLVLLGCSFTYGYGLSDRETYPYLLDSACSEFSVKNLSCPSDGTLQSLLRLKRYLACNSCNSPLVVVLNYLSFHDERNCLNASYRAKIYEGYLALKQSSLTAQAGLNLAVLFPYIDAADEQHALHYVSYDHLVDWDVPFVHELALSNLLSAVFIKAKCDPRRERQLSIYLIRQIQQLCTDSNIRFCVSYMENPAQIRDVLDSCRVSGIETIDLSIDFNDRKNFNYPADPVHPNAKANRVFMTKFLKHIRDNWN